MGIIIWFIGLFASFAQIAIRHYKLRHIPGPKRDGFLHGHILTITRVRNTEGHINDWFYSLSKTHGDVFVFWVYNIPKFVLSNSKHARSLLSISPLPKSHCQSPFAVFNEISSERMLDGCGYKSILTDHCSDNMAQRRSVYLKSLRVKNMTCLMEPVLQVTDEMIMQLNKETLDLVPMKTYICLFVHDCISEALFGLEAASFGKKNPLYNFFVKAETASKNRIRNKRKTDFSGGFLQDSENVNVSTEVMEIRRMIYEHVQITKQLLRRRNNSKRLSESNLVFPDLISSILESDELSQPVNDEEIVNDVVSMFIMGRETLTSALIQVLHQILSDRAVYIRLIAEIELLLGEAKHDITFEQVNKLSYLDAVIKETLRLFPSIPATRKKLSRRKWFGKYRIDNPAVMLVSTYNIHRDPKVYKDPNTFNPDRFLDKKFLYPCELFPFSFGPRTCIGSQFSLLCMKVFIVKLFRMFDVRSVEPSKQPRYTDYISLRLDSELPCTLKKTMVNERTFTG